MVVFVSLPLSHATAPIPHILPVSISLTHIVVDWILLSCYTLNVPCSVHFASASQHAFSVWPIKGSITIWPEKAEPDGIQKKTSVEESTLENIIEKRP